MDRNELRKALKGIIAATVTPFDDEFEVDHGRMAELTRWWVESGLVAGKAVIKVASVMGEGPMLRDDEWPPLVRTVVQAANGRVPVMSSSHCKDTRRTIEDAKRAQDLGAVGIQIAAPMFNDPTQDDILRYYEAISNAVEIGIMVYNNHWYPSSAIFPETFQKMADLEHVVAIKWNPPPGVEYESMIELAPMFNILDNSNKWVRCHQLGGHGFLDNTVTAYPPHDLAIWALLEGRRHDEAQSLIDTVDAPMNDFYEKVSKRSGGQSRVKKGLMAVMGRPVGSMRPPSEPLNDEELEELRQIVSKAGWPVPGAVEAAGTPA